MCLCLFFRGGEREREREREIQTQTQTHILYLTMIVHFRQCLFLQCVIGSNKKGTIKTITKFTIGEKKYNVIK